MSQPLALSNMNAGLTNQKLAIIGLVLEGIRRCRPIVLPRLTDFFAGRLKHPQMEFDAVFDQDLFISTSATAGLRVVATTEEIELLDGWECFRSVTAEFSSLERSNDLHPEALPCALLAALRPAARVAETASKALDSIKSQEVNLICQLRIENDWQAYAQQTLLQRVQQTEDCPLTATDILAKMTTIVRPETGPVYVTCNEDDLPISTEEISRKVRDELGYRMLWKKDIIDTRSISGWSYLERALFDFEVALGIANFVGTTRSTFFNVAALTSFCRGESEVERFFAYNVTGHALPRTDHGAFASAPEATSSCKREVVRPVPALSNQNDLFNVSHGDNPVRVQNAPSNGSEIKRVSTDNLRSFYIRYSDSPADGWAADFSSSAEPHYIRAQESVAEIFHLSSLPLQNPRSYLEYLKQHHEKNKGGVYCEVGINHGASLALGHDARLAIGVDPMPRIEPGTFESDPFVVVRTTSDKFFSSEARAVLKGSTIDLTFIDGLHIFEFALRDFIGAERLASPDGTILIHDVLPRTEFEAARLRATRSWTGDVWRLVYVLKHFRPNLTIQVLDAQPTGLAVVSGLEPSNHEMITRYKEIVQFGRGMSSSSMMLNRDEILGVEASGFSESGCSDSR